MLQYVLGYTFLFCLLGLIFWLPGMVLLGLFSPPRVPSPFRRLAEICVGLTAWTAWMFLLATIGQLHRPAIGLFGAIWPIAALFFRTRIKPAPNPKSAIQNPKSEISVVLPALIIIPCFIVALGPTLAWDASAYHLTLPKLYIAHGGFRPVEMNIYSNWPSNIELLYTVAMLAKDYILATSLHVGFGILTLYAIYCVCRSSPHPRSALLGMALFLTNVIVLWEMTVAYVDLAYAFFFTAGFAFIAAARDHQPHRPLHLLLAGLCCGLLAGLKVTGFLGAAVLAAGLLPALLAPKETTRRSELKTLAAWFLFPALILALPWAIKAAWYTGNPCYPFLHRWFGGPDWSETLSQQFAAWHKNVGMGRSFTDYLRLPFRVILYGRMGGGRFDRFDGKLWEGWIILLPLAVLLCRRLPLVRRSLATCGLYFVLWAISSQQIRFLIPILPLLSIAAAVAVHEGIARLPSERWRKILPCAAVAVAMTAALAANLGNDQRGLRLLATLHRDGPDAVRRSAIEPYAAFVNRELPPDARLLMLNTNQAFFMDREYLADSCCEASQITDWLESAPDRHEIRRRLATRHVSHVLFRKFPPGAPYPRPLWDLLADPNLAQSIYRSPDDQFELWALRPAS